MNRVENRETDREGTKVKFYKVIIIGTLRIVTRQRERECLFRRGDNEGTGARRAKEDESRAEGRSSAREVFEKAGVDRRSVGEIEVEEATGKGYQAV